MSPIPGIVASQISGHLASPTSYESIATVTLSSDAASISFNSIPGTYKHLQLRTKTRQAVATTGGQSQMRINGDTGANYTYHSLYGYGSGIASDGAGNNAWAYGVDRYTGGNDPANIFGSTILDFFDYTNTSKYKTLRTFGGYDANGSGSVKLHAALWMSTSAITSLYFENQGGGNYAAGTVWSLYGVKG